MKVREGTDDMVDAIYIDSANERIMRDEKSDENVLK
jgi:hypothetical protein